MKVAAYLRVSTDRQVEKGQGLDIQRASIKEWAKENGHRVVLWSQDKGTSGSNGLEDREGLFEAISSVQDGTTEGLVVYRLDRLAREFVLQETLLSMIWKAGGRVYSCSPAENDYLDPERPLDDADNGLDPSRTLIRQILGVIAEYERSMIRLRMRTGKLAKRARGGHVGGDVPYGYQLADDGDALIECAEEQEAIKRMLDLRGNGTTFRAICRDLDEQGIKTRRGGIWQPATVRNIIERANRHAE